MLIKNKKYINIFLKLIKKTFLKTENSVYRLACSVKYLK